MSGGDSRCVGKGGDEDVRLIAGELREYLNAHPDAADTLSGVVHWWLERQRTRQQSEMVRRALEYLVDEGLVERQSSPDGGVVYRVRKD